MNRRGFLSALALAPVAAVVAPATLVKPAYASGGMIAGSAAKWGIVGEIGPELILPSVPAAMGIEIDISGEVDAHIREIVRQGIREAMMQERRGNHLSNNRKG